MATDYTIAQIPGAQKTYREYDYTKKPGAGILVLRIRELNPDAIATATGTALQADDVFPCIPVYGGETVIRAGINTTTVATGAAIMDLGFASGIHFVDGQAANDLSLPSATQHGDNPGMHIPIGTIDWIDLNSETASLAGWRGTVWALIARFSKTEVANKQ
jgi:hypothetical protein